MRVFVSVNPSLAARSQSSLFLPLPRYLIHSFAAVFLAVSENIHKSLVFLCSKSTDVCACVCVDVRMYVLCT